VRGKKWGGGGLELGGNEFKPTKEKASESALSSLSRRKGKGCGEETACRPRD